MQDNVHYIQPRRTEKVKEALARALDDFGLHIRGKAQRGDMQAIKALSMFAGIAPMAKMFITKLSDEDADGLMRMLEKFMADVNG